MTEGLSNLKQKLIYSWKRNKQTGEELHNLCDGHTPLLFLIILTSGFMLGGYIYSQLDREKKVAKDSMAGCFSFFGDKAYFYGINAQEIKYEAKGFSFGIPPNLYIDLESIDESHCGFDLKFKSPLGSEITFKISSNFVWSLMVKEISVYKLS